MVTLVKRPSCVPFPGEYTRKTIVCSYGAKGRAMLATFARSTSVIALSRSWMSSCARATADEDARARATEIRCVVRRIRCLAYTVVHRLTSVFRCSEEGENRVLVLTGYRLLEKGFSASFG